QHVLHSVEVRVSVRLTNLMGGSVIGVLHPRGMQRVSERPWLGAIPTLHSIWQMLDSRLELLARIFHLRSFGLGLCKPLLRRLLRLPLLSEFCSALGFSETFLDGVAGSVPDRVFLFHVLKRDRCVSNRVRRLCQLGCRRCRHRLSRVVDN